MKKIVLLFVTVLFYSSTSWSQDNKTDEIQTIFGDDISFGGYGAYVMKMSPVNNKLGLFVGGKGGCIINHQLTIGGGGYGLTTNSKFSVMKKGFLGNDSMISFNTKMGYGGLMFEYTLLSNNAIHLSFPVMLAGGDASVNYRDNYDYQNNTYGDYYYDKTFEQSSFFVFEPGVDAEFNILKFFRIGLGASYRYIVGSDMIYLSDKDLSDMSFNLTFKFGYF